MLPKSHSCLGRKRWGIPRQVPCHWQASLRQDLYLVVTGSVLGSLSESLLVVSQLECPLSFFGAASTSAPPYKADPGKHSHCPFWSPFMTRSSVRGWVFYNPPIPGDSIHTLHSWSRLSSQRPLLPRTMKRYTTFNMPSIRTTYILYTYTYSTRILPHTKGV
jgi:hypothetical protein